MPHVNQLVDKYGKKGFVAIGVTNEPEAPTEKFVEETQMKAIVAYEKSLASMKAYGFDGFPSSVLIGPDGKVVWSGHPSGLTEKIIEDNLVGVKMSAGGEGPLSIDVELPKKHQAIQKQLMTGKLGAARPALEKSLSDQKLSPEDKKSLEGALADLDELLASMMKSADESFDGKRLFDAESTWKKVVTHFEGLDGAATAKSRLAELAKDPAAKNELDAGRRIAQAMKSAEAGKTKEAVSTLKGIVEGPLKSTNEAARAKTLMDEYMSQGDK